MSGGKILIALLLVGTATACGAGIGESPSAPREGAAAAAAQSYADINAPFDSKYHFVRIRYGGGFGGFRRGRRGGSERRDGL